MYEKCWDLTDARVIFERMLQRNESRWNAMISGFVCHGHCKEAIDFFHIMEQSREKPNEITFLSVLSACAHVGFVMDGLEIFYKINKYGLTASIKHYSCLVDLLGMAERLIEAYDPVNKMAVKPNGTVWGALLEACLIHSDIDMANQCLKMLSDKAPAMIHTMCFCLISIQLPKGGKRLKG